MAKKVKLPKIKKAKKVFKKKMEAVMKEAKKGELNIGKSKKKVKGRKQAIAIALAVAEKAAKIKKVSSKKKKKK